MIIRYPIFSPAFGLIRLPCPSVLSCDSKRTDKVSDSKLCRNATYVNGSCWLDFGPNRFMMSPAGLLITAIWTCFKSVAYKYVSSFVMLWNSYALLADWLQNWNWNISMPPNLRSIHYAIRLTPDTSIRNYQFIFIHDMVLWY
jgi:hypothetical protein